MVRERERQRETGTENERERELAGMREDGGTHVSCW